MRVDDRPEGINDTPDGSRLDSFTKGWLPFLTAILVAVTAALGLYAALVTTAKASETEKADSLAKANKNLNSDNENLDSTVSSLASQNSQLTTENEKLNSTNSSLVEENDTLRGSSTTTTKPASDGPEIWRESGANPVVIQFNGGFDLDSLAPNWGIDGNHDIAASYSSFERHITDSGNSSQFSIVKATPTIEACKAQTIVTERLSTAETVEGQLFCVRTSEGRSGYVRIAAINPTDRTFSFDVLIWKLPTDP
jgi:hypothetical protein